MSVAVKLAGRSLPVEMLVLARAAVTLVMSAAWVWGVGIHPWGNQPKLLVLRGLLGVGGLVCFFYAVTVLPLAEVTVMHYLNPVFTALVASVWLGERVDRRLVVAIALSMIGTVVVARPAALVGAPSDLHALGVAAALGGAVFAGFAYATVRRLSRTENAHVIVFYFPLVAVPATLPFAIRAWVWPDAVGWLLLLAIGVSTQFAQVLFTKGMACLPAGRATTVGYVQIIIAASWGILLFDERPSLWTALGAGLIILGTASLLHRGEPVAPEA